MTITFLGRPIGGIAKLASCSFHLPAGFPSPATDHLESDISLVEHFELRAPHACLIKIEWDSTQSSGILSGDLVIVDSSREAEHGDVVIAALNNEPVCKRMNKRDCLVKLKSESPSYPVRCVLEGDELLIRGVVRSSVRDHAK